MLTVTELIHVINTTLRDNYPSVSFVGEVSTSKLYGSGHTYLSIKDENSEVQAVLWKGTRTAYKPVVGDQVSVEGYPTVYNKGGRFQIVITKIEPTGEGLLLKKFLELKDKLEKEGLFERKRPIPKFPKAVGVVTSASGAVIRDIDVKIRERLPSLKVYLVDVRVQGSGAAEEIAVGVRKLAQSGLVDVIIVARGGGSLEDLWPFNEEVVVRAIFASKVPVVSGIGHETDTTLADLVADYRAPTPTAAAEYVTPSRDQLLREISELERRFFKLEWLNRLMLDLDESAERFDLALKNSLEKKSLKLDRIAQGITRISPNNIVANLRSKLLGLEERIFLGANQKIKILANQIKALPSFSMSDRFNKIKFEESRLERGVFIHVKSSRDGLVALAKRLKALSPEEVLNRGYSIVEDENGVPIAPQGIKVQDSISIRFAAKRLKARVTEI